MEHAAIGLFEALTARGRGDTIDVSTLADKAKGVAMEPMPESMGMGLIVLGIFLLVVFAVLITVIPFWRICEKAGFPGVLSLLMLVPLGNLVLPFYLAFVDWPALKQTQPAPPQPA